MRGRSELSIKNKYYISKHRYLELRHMCLQYREWAEKYSDSIGYGKVRYDVTIRSLNDGDSTSDIAIVKSYYKRKMDLVKKVAYDTDSEIGDYIFKAVTEDLSYVNLRYAYGMPCGEDLYFDRYHKFFWLLDKEI